MPISIDDAQRIAHAGVDALKRNDPQCARQLFEELVAANHADVSVLFGLAYACRSLGDDAAAISAVDAALSLESRHLQSLMLKADLLDSVGDTRSAATFYSVAIKSASAEPQLSLQLQRELQRAEAMCRRYQIQFESYLRKEMIELSARLGDESARFAQSLDLLSGKKQIFFQQPKVYYFPELPQVQFPPRNGFSWLERLEAATSDIREELLAIMKDNKAFVPYVQDVEKRPKRQQDSLLNSPNWGAFYLWRNGEIVTENAARCPKTLAAIEGLPLVHMKGRSPSIMFSLLLPGTRIPPHCGLVNTRLICHLPLIVPAHCGLRVGNETREFVEGRAWLFDDTIEHEAWNLSDTVRVILLFEVWRPELTLTERTMVGAMFDAIDMHHGGAPTWSI